MELALPARLIPVSEETTEKKTLTRPRATVIPAKKLSKSVTPQRRGPVTVSFRSSRLWNASPGFRKLRENTWGSSLTALEKGFCRVSPY